MTVRRLLCPIDFSDPSEAALAYASELALQLGAELHVLHTWQLSAYASPTSDLAKDTERSLEKDLSATIQRAVTNGVAVSKHLRLGPAAETIVAAARELKIDHIVMGTNGKTGIERMLVGSVAEEVVRKSELPVTTMRTKPARH
jgi:nucleotide-binding universal stress UspA family protein